MSPGKALETPEKLGSESLQRKQAELSEVPPHLAQQKEIEESAVGRPFCNNLPVKIMVTF